MGLPILHFLHTVIQKKTFRKARRIFHFDNIFEKKGRGI